MSAASRWVVAVVAACACLVPFGISAADQSDAFGRTRYVYACERWTPAQPVAAVDLFDVFGPSNVLRQAVLQAGGRIVHEFNVPTVRARLRVSEIPGLPLGFYAISVEQPNRYPVDAIIGFRAAVTDTDRAFLASVGATILKEYRFIHAVHAIVPDEAIPAVRANPSVRYVELNVIGCLLGSQREGQPNQASGMGAQSVASPMAAPSTTWGQLKALYR